MFWIAIAIAIGVLLVWPGGFRPRVRRAPKLETIVFVDGPLAGRTDNLAAGSDGLPPHQFCATVARSSREGGDYTLPYQRGPISESRHAWKYTQGWTTAAETVANPFGMDQLPRRG